MKRLYIYLMMIWGGLGSLFADEVNSFHIQWHGADSVTVEFPLVVPEAQKCGNNYAVCMMPYLCNSEGDTLQLSPVIFRGKTNRRYIRRARHFGDVPEAVSVELPLKDTLHFSETFATADIPWLTGNTVQVGAHMEKEGCCKVVPFGVATFGHFTYIPPFEPEVQPVVINMGIAAELQKIHPILQPVESYRPYDNTRILRKEKGMLYVNFPVDKSDLLRDFRNNASTLDTIISLTSKIMADTVSQVKLIQIVGMASVEGRIKHNEDLAQARAEVLKEYVQERVAIPDSLFELNNAGEGWTEMRDQINDLQFEGRDELLAIIDETEDPNERERKIRRHNGGRSFSFLKDNVLIDQRNSGYLRVYYEYVPDTAAATINEAAELMGNEHYAEALKLLQTVEDDPRAQNALGVALYMTGDEAAGIRRLEAAAATGDVQAKANIESYKAKKAAEERALP